MPKKILPPQEASVSYFVPVASKVTNTPSVHVNISSNFVPHVLHPAPQHPNSVRGHKGEVIVLEH